MFYLPNQQRFDALNPKLTIRKPKLFDRRFAASHSSLHPSCYLKFPIWLRATSQPHHRACDCRQLEDERGLSVDARNPSQSPHRHQSNRPRLLLTSNEASAVAVGLVTPGSNPLGVIVPSTPNTTATLVPVRCPRSQRLTPPPAALLLPLLPVKHWLLAPWVSDSLDRGCSAAPVGLIGTPAFFNFFRKSGPNPSFATGVGGGFEWPRWSLQWSPP